MKTPKVITFISAAFFFLAAIGTYMQIPHFRGIIVDQNLGGVNSMFVPPIVEIVFALGSFLFGLYLIKQGKKGVIVEHARLISIILIVLSIALPYALTVWFILLPVYNASA